MITTDELFADLDNEFYDIVAEIDLPYSKKLTIDHLRILFGRLPEDIRNLAHSWGMGDTVFRDDAYEYFCHHPDRLMIGEVT
jgi:hypothetical protein